MSNGDNEMLRDWMALHLVQGLGSVAYKNLIDFFGSPATVLEADLKGLSRVKGIRRDIKESLVNTDRAKLYEESAKELEKCDEAGISIITLKNPGYPPLLANIHNPPPLLYVKGSLKDLNCRGLGIVGSRAATGYGKRIAGKMAEALTREGFTIISGLALGIDTEAHCGALQGGGKTIAVLGCGLDMLYPPENKRLHQQIITSGAIVSEYPLGTKPDGFRFPARNRIISGLSLGVVVVEAAQKSGSLITAKHALEQGREVFAVPGQVDSFKSTGTHSLLQQGAKLVQNISDITEELELTGMISPKGTSAGMTDAVNFNRTSQKDPLSDEEEKVFSHLDVYPINIDDIVRDTKLPTQKVNELLLMLELKGIVEALPGKKYLRT